MSDQGSDKKIKKDKYEKLEFKEAIHSYLSRQERFSVGMKEAIGPGYK